MAATKKGKHKRTVNPKPAKWFEDGSMKKVERPDAMQRAINKFKRGLKPRKQGR